MVGVLKWIPSNHALQGLQSWRLVCHYTCMPNLLKSSRDAFNFVMGINFCRKAVSRNLFSKKKAFSKYPKINSLQN